MAKSGWCLTTDHAHCTYRGCLCPCHPEPAPAPPTPQETP